MFFTGGLSLRFKALDDGLWQAFEQSSSELRADREIVLKAVALKGEALRFAAHEHKVKNEKSAQRGSFWDGHPADIRGPFARISRPKTSVRAVKMLEKKQAFRRGHP